MARDCKYYSFGDCEIDDESCDYSDFHYKDRCPKYKKRHDDDDDNDDDFMGVGLGVALGASMLGNSGFGNGGFGGFGGGGFGGGGSGGGF